MTTQAISTFFSQSNAQSAESLATLVNRQSDLVTLSTPSPTNSSSPLSPSAARLILLSHFYLQWPSQIDSSVIHPGHSPEDRYANTLLRPSNGPGILAEHLSHALYRALWGHVSRTRTPDEDLDREHPTKYYADASIHATILARAFATQRAFRDITICGGR